ncbi:MAG: hypothetical protein LBP26_02655 [Clostridiales bacterium]|jgi:hypothetical protein|nr:hypothetical protein [Clostridiales bacterium]
MNNIDELELTPRQRLAGNLTAGGVILLCGIFLLLCGLGAVPLSVTKIWLCSVLTAVGLVLLITGFIQRNTVSVWLAFAFLVPALVEGLAKSGTADYGNLYPLYIAIPAVASLVTMLYGGAWRSHVPVIALFGPVAAIFSLNSSGALEWAIVIPLLIVFIGAVVILSAALSNRGADDDGE